MPESKHWHTIAAFVIMVVIAVAAVGLQSVVLIWAVRQLGSEWPIDVRRVVAVGALLMMFYGTLDHQRKRWRK